jgi:rhomboid protease GluP
MTVFLVALILAVYLVELMLSAHGLSAGALFASPSLGTMVAMGAQVGSLVVAGQWWRIVTAMFLHFNWLHIGTNAYSLYIVGGLVEPAFGSWRTLIIYLLSGILGGLFLLLLMPLNVVGAGASGAIFGLLGATVVLGFFLPRGARRGLLSWAIGIFVLNIGFDLFDPAIAIWDHVGGFVGGLLLAWALGVPGRQSRLATVAWVLYLALAVGILRLVA